MIFGSAKIIAIFRGCRLSGERNGSFCFFFDRSSKKKTSPPVFRGEVMLHGTTLITPCGASRPSCNVDEAFRSSRTALRAAALRRHRGASTVPLSLRVRFAGLFPRLCLCPLLIIRKICGLSIFFFVIPKIVRRPPVRFHHRRNAVQMLRQRTRAVVAELRDAISSAQQYDLPRAVAAYC